MHLQMESSLLVWAQFQERKKKGEKPGGDLNALIFTLGRTVLLESRLSREGKGILGCEYCVLVASNANIDKGSLVPTKTAIRPTTDGKTFFLQCCRLQANCSCRREVKKTKQRLRHVFSIHQC